ncbi:minichromosome instability 12 (mis12)-like [Raphanus sativus]|uniref:Protein MIS12 homolog n=1 Tax=Raphanus sativus TaxID=3726 RepID=A0A6J0KZ94_RAPSA|nr:protein MIS12 homolog [Raphanus sativus]KAJ4874956.1 minichromosome instability 12 (mis12)-like [Raphanus sativus]
MEGSKGEAVYDSMNLNPHLFINAALNFVQDVVDEAFHFYTLEASNLLKIDERTDNNRSRELSKGIDRVRDMIQSVLDNRLEMWEHYCLRYTFAVPQDFVLLPPTQSDDDRNIQPLTNDQELDSELDSLRRKLHLVGNRSVELNSELQALERKSASNARLVDEASKLYDQSSVDMFEEMTKVASELRTGIINRLKARNMNAAAESALVETLKNNVKNDFSATAPDGKIEDLDKFLAELRKM